MSRVLEVNNELDKQSSDKQMTIMYSCYTAYIVANGANGLSLSHNEMGLGITKLWIIQGSQNKAENLVNASVAKWHTHLRVVDVVHNTSLLYGSIYHTYKPLSVTA